MLLLSPRCSRLEYPQKPEANSGRNTATLPSNSLDVKAMRQKAAVTRPRGGMARRQGGSFNSILARRKSPLVSQSSEQQSARGEKTYEAKKNTHNNTRFCAYFSRAWLSDGTGVPLPLGNIVLCGWTPAFSFFFRYFICQIIAAATLSHSNHTVAQPSLVRGEKGRG